MTDSTFPDVQIEDMWDTLPERIREEFLTRRVAATQWGAYGRQNSDSRRWEPLRPVVLHEHAYRYLESIAAGLLRLAVEACQRRASTLGELHRVLRFHNELPLMDPHRPLMASELTRYARPDLLIEQGRPRLLEFNNSTRLGGDTVTPRLAQAFAHVCPQAGLRPPRSVVTARSEALLDTLDGQVGPDRSRRLLVPNFWAMDGTGSRQRYERIKKPVLADLQRVGFEVVQADLADLHVGRDMRLFAGRTPIDLVLIQWGSGEAARIVDDGGGLAALRTADRAGTITFFPRTESVLISSKSILAWMHEDCQAGLLAPADSDLVRNYVPTTTTLGLTDAAVAQDALAVDTVSSLAIGDRERLVIKPAGGKSGTGVRFGSQLSRQDWLAAVLHSAKEAPVVLQQRVESDRITMPFLDRDTGQLATTPVPFVLSPFMVDRAATDIGVRHMAPDAPTQDVVISVSHGARSNTVVLTAP